MLFDSSFQHLDFIFSFAEISYNQELARHDKKFTMFKKTFLFLLQFLSQVFEIVYKDK